MYWAIAASYKVFGISDWSPRLPIVLAMLCLLLSTDALGRYVYGETGGLFSALALCTCIGPYIFTRFQIPEILVALCMRLALYFFLKSVEQEPPSRLVCWGFATCCALNVLTKGLIGLVFPIGSAVVYLLLTRDLRRLLRCHLISSTIVFFTIAVPWHVLAALRNPAQGSVRGFLWFYFVNEQFLRYLNKRVPPGYDTVPLFIFWGLLVLWLMPWTVFLPQALREIPATWRGIRGELSFRQKANLIFLLSALLVVVFFSFSTRQEYYTIPALPGLALLVGGWLAKESKTPADSAERRAGRISALVLFGIGVVASLIGLGFFLFSFLPAAGTDLADLLKKKPQEYDLALGHLLDLTPGALTAFQGPLLGTVVLLFLGTWLNWFLRERERVKQANFVVALMMFGLLTCVHSAFVTFSPILSSSQLAVAIEHDYKPGDLVVVDGEYDEASTLNFYTGLPLRVLHEPSGNLWYGSQFPDAPNVFETAASFAALWNGSSKVFLWSTEDEPKVLRGRARRLLARSGGKYIFTNRKSGN